MTRPTRNYPKRRPSKHTVIKPIRKYLWIGIGIVLCCFIIYHYRAAFAYYLGFKSDKIRSADVFSEARNLRILEKHENKILGIDVSEYQGKISWTYVDSIENKYPLHFVFVRATAGNDAVDSKFKRNWEGAKKNRMIRGAYHYYRPNENSLEQAKLFIKTVRLSKGDLPPVLDIERMPENQSMSNLKKGLRRWLLAVENHYKVKPIIYTGEKYYDDFLKEEFSDYLFWIANYNFYRETIQDDWLFWQFTEKASVPGIESNVDVNIYNGDLQQLRFITIE